MSGTPAGEASMDTILASIRRMMSQSERDSAARTDESPLAGVQHGPPAAYAPLAAASPDAGAGEDRLTDSTLLPLADRLAAIGASSGDERGNHDVADGMKSDDDAASGVSHDGAGRSDAPATSTQTVAPPGRASLPLVGERTAREVQAVLSRLRSVTTAGETLHDEALVPLIAGWLDANLPTIVERIVRDEIRRLMDGGTHDAGSTPTGT